MKISRDKGEEMIEENFPELKKDLSFQIINMQQV